MAATPAGIEARVRTLAQDVASRAGYELVDVEYRREPGGWTLRLFIDKHGGVNLEDCERVSHELGTLLEVEDPISQPYNLEVSSPGLDRPLVSDSDFLAAEGKLVRLVTREPIEGQRHFSGRLIGVHPSGIACSLRIRDDAGAEHEIALTAIQKARLIPEWPAAPGKGTKKGRGSGRKV